MKIQNTNAKTTLIVVALLGAATLVEIARADDFRADVPAKTVGYQDLNLSTPAGVQVLYKRIQVAAKQVCGEVPVRDVRELRAHQACVNHAVTDAVVTINNQLLTQTATVTVAQVR